MRAYLVCILGFLLMGFRGGCDCGGEEVAPANKYCLTDEDCAMSGLENHYCGAKPDAVNGFKICIDRNENVKIVEKEVEKIVYVYLTPDGGSVDASEPVPDAGNEPDAGGSPDVGVLDAGNFLDAGPVIEMINITDVEIAVTEDCARLSWKTGMPSTSNLNTVSFVNGTTGDFVGAYFRSVSQGGLRAGHQGEVCGLQPNSRHTFEIVARHSAGYGEQFGTFITLEHLDRTPPDILHVQSHSSTTDETQIVVVASEKIKLVKLFYKMQGEIVFTEAPPYLVNPSSESAQLELVGLTAGKSFTAYVEAYNLVGLKKTSAEFQFSTLAISYDVFPPFAEAFAAGAQSTTSVKVGWWASEPVAGELWCAVNPAQLSDGAGAFKYALPIPSGKTAVNGGFVTAGNLTTNTIHWCKLVVFDTALTPNRYESTPAFTIQAEPTLVLSTPITAKVVIGALTDTPTTSLSLHLSASRPVLSTEVRYGTDPNLATYQTWPGQGGANFESIMLTGLPVGSMIFFKSFVTEQTGSTPAESLIGSSMTWSIPPIGQFDVRCDAAAGPACRIWAISERSINGEWGQLGQPVQFDFKWFCERIGIDRPLQEIVQLNSSAGPDAVRIFWVNGEPMKHNGSYILPRSTNPSTSHLVALKKLFMRCPQAGYP